MISTSSRTQRQPHTKQISSDKKSHNGNVSQHKYDDESGQVYHETEVIFRRKNATNWTRDLRTPAIARKAESSNAASRSLFDIAKTKCVNELRSFAPEHFQFVPWTIAETLWNEVVTRHMESLYVWKLLASQYNGEDEFGKPDNRYFLALRQTPLPMSDYYHGLTSRSHKWHVAARISPKQHSTSDLVAISNITNLAALDLSDGQLLLDTRPSVFDHRIMRTWAELAQSQRAFRDLRVLMLGWQDNLSGWIFQYLDKFPSLCYLIVTDCKELHQKNRSTWEETASQTGWTALHAKRSAKTLRAFLDGSEFQLGNISNLYYQSHAMVDANVMTDGGRGRVLPIVECWIGTPRPWTHIIDEFPGTRTIWFEKTSSCLQNIPLPTSEKIREAPRSTQTRSSLPSKRPQRQVREKGRGKRAAEAAAILAELDSMMGCK